MKLLIFFIYLGILSVVNVSPQSTDLSRSKNIRVKFSFENENVADLTYVGILIQFRKIGENTWNTVFSKEDNLDPSISLELPDDGVVSIQVTTVDPTIIASDSKVEFFTLDVGQTHTMLHKQVKLASFSNEKIQIPIVLKRVSAIKLCIPNNFNSGSVQLVRPGNAEKRALVYSVSKSEFLKDHWFGGIEPGSWEVIYMDDNDNIFLRDQLLTIRSEVYPLQCAIQK